MTQENKPPKIESLDEVVIEEIKAVRVRIGDYAGPGYTEIGEIRLICGKLAYIAKKDNGKWVASFDGEEGPEYSRVNYLTQMNGKLAYTAEKENGKLVVVFDGKEGHEYELVMHLTCVCNKLAYEATKDATRAFKNRDIVEVDADEGVVRKL